MPQTLILPPVAPQVGLATTQHRDLVAAMLARAFADDPAMSYIFPDPAVRRERLPRLFRLLYESDGRTGLRLMAGDAAAATLWRAPGAERVGWREMLGQAWPLCRALGGAIGRALSVAHAVEAHFPPEPVWYLHIAGCEPALQGRGLGGAAVRAGLDRIAGSGLPAYLETATARNVGFYRALGFVVTEEWDVPRGGPHFWSMRRDPAANRHGD